MKEEPVTNFVDLGLVGRRLKAEGRTQTVPKSIFGSSLFMVFFQEMEANSASSHHEAEEEFVLLDLEYVHGIADIPPNAPYILYELDTLNPILIIDNKLKLIRQYEETIGTCVVFSQQGMCLSVGTMIAG